MKKLTLAKETLKRLDDQDVLAAAAGSSGCPTLTLCHHSNANSCRVCQITVNISACNACNPN